MRAPGPVAVAPRPAPPKEKARLISEERLVSARSLNVRAGPSGAAAVIASATLGTRLNVLGHRDGWLHVSLAGGGRGWVAARHTVAATAGGSPVKPPPAAAAAPRAVPGSNARKDQIIARSIGSYSGNCPCPYNVDRAGHQCGKRSAYSKPGGASPICYREDVTEAMLLRFQ